MRNLTEEDIVPKLKIDQEIELNEINDKFVETLDSFAPFGPQNMKPVFLTRNVEILGRPHVVGNNHLKMRVRKGDAVLDLIGYGFGGKAQMLADERCLVDLVYVVEFNTYNNITRLQIRLRDIKLTVSTSDAGYR